MKKAHRIALAVAIATFVASMLFCPAFGGDNASRFPTGLDAEFSVTADFASPLPLLVLELSQAGDTSKSVAGLMTVYDKPGGANSLGDNPANVSPIEARVWAAATDAGKYKYAIRLAPVGETAATAVSFAGLAADTQWILYGSLRDKGMLRNGVAHALGRILFGDDAPETRFCEVLVKHGDRYEYHGIHILSAGDQPEEKSSNSGGGSFLIQYSPGTDRLGNNVVRLGSRIFTVISPSDEGDRAESQRTIAVELAKLDNALQSIRPEAFLAYKTTLDQRSAIDLYILNSLTLNALDTKASFRLFKNQSGRLQFLPVWDFDRALDNTPAREYPLPFEEKISLAEPPSLLSRRLPVWRTLEAGGDIRDLRVYPAYQTLDGENFLWFDRLFLSRSFLMELYERYHILRRTVLSPEAVQGMVDGIIAELGPALDRDWARWNREYTAAAGPYALSPFIDEEGIRHIRQTVSSDQDVVKIRRNLREQDAFLMEQMEQLAWMTVDLYDSGTAGNRQAAYALGVIVGMMALMHLLSKKL